MRRTLPTSLKFLFATPLFSSRPGRTKDRASARGQFESLEDRRALATLPAGFVEVEVASGFSSPTAMEFSPTGELWVLEQSGAVNLVLSSGTQLETIDLAVTSSGERGLLGIAFDSDYDGTGPNTDYVYLYYTEPAGPSGDPPNNRLSRFTLSGVGTEMPMLGSELILRDLPPEAEDGNTNHNGGAIHFGPDGKLYVAVGDHNYDTTPQSAHVSQILTTPFGKILRLNADGTNPDDNPFYTGSATDWEGSIHALGLRNPYTFAFDPDSGTMFINDVGEGSWEEINQGEAAANYGWAGSTSPLWEGFENDGTPPPWTNYHDPVMAYDHTSSPPTPAGVAITGGAFYPSNRQFGSDYAGLYFFADYIANFIRIFDPDNPGSLAVPDTSTGFATGASGTVDLKVDAQGNLHYLARGGGGAVYRISFTGVFGPTQVETRQIFYNNSAFDNNDPEANAADDAAIATDKSAYVPGGGVAGPDNTTSYTRGINGIMVDLSGNHGPLTAADFTFKVGANNLPSTWADAPAPTGFAVRAGAGDGGSDRVEIVWDDNAIKNTYLQVIVEGNDATGGFNTNTGLASSDVFFFGNRASDSGTGTPATFFQTTTSDASQVFGNLTGSAAVDNLHDYDRSGNVTTGDSAIVFSNLGILARIDISAGGPSAPEPGPAGAGDDGGSNSAVASALTMADSSSGEPTSAPNAVRPTRAEGDERPIVETRTRLADEANRRAQAILTLGDESAESSWLDDEVLDALLVDLARK